MPNSEPNADCYSKIDRKMMIWFQNVRAKNLKPLLLLLTKWKLKADSISGISLFTGILAVAAFKWNITVAFILLLLHIILDGLDGPLARFRKEATAGGSFVDSCCDQMVVALTTLVFVQMGILVPTLAGFYVFAYTVVVAFSMIRNAIEIPYSFLIRPRFFFYIAAFIELFWLPGTLNIACILFTLILIFHMLCGFFALRKYLQQKRHD